MRETALTCDPGDGALWVLPGVGTLRRTGRISRAATAEADGRRWKIVRYGLVRTGFTASDETGAVVGELRNPFQRRGEMLRWAGRDLTLRADKARAGGYLLFDGERLLAGMAPKRNGRRPLHIAIEDPAVDPGLLLLMAFVVQAYADDASFPQPMASG